MDHCNDLRLKKPLLLFTVMAILLNANVVAAAKRSVFFTPFFELSVEPRRGKAEVADGTEESLMKAGFFPIGVLEVRYRVNQAGGIKGPKTYKYPEDPTKDLRKWGAKNGGDVIHISRTNLPTDGIVTWTEDVWHNKYEGTRYTKKAKADYMSSFATVYRKDPALDMKIRSDTDILKKYFYIRGNILLDNDNFFGARREYGKALEIDPAYVDAHIGTGIAKMGHGFDLGALSDFSRTMELDPGDPRPYYFRGQAHLKIWNTAEAIPDLEKYLSLDNKHTEAYYLLGIAYERQNQREDALKYYLYFINNAELPRLDSLVEDAVVRMDKIKGK